MRLLQSSGRSSRNFWNGFRFRRYWRRIRGRRRRRRRGRGGRSKYISLRVCENIVLLFCFLFQIGEDGEERRVSRKVTKKKPLKKTLLEVNPTIFAFFLQYIRDLHFSKSNQANWNAASLANWTRRSKRKTSRNDSRYG